MRRVLAVRGPRFGVWGSRFRVGSSQPICAARRFLSDVYDFCFWFMVSVFCFLVPGLWFMVYDLWFMVCGLWFMVYGLGFRV